MAEYKRVVVIVLDGVGIGELPDADLYGDNGCNTLANTAMAAGGLRLPNMQALGLGRIGDIQGVPANITPTAFFGKMAEASCAKDSTAGHWEIAGVVTKKPFPTYPNGFPSEVINRLRDITGRNVIGNKPSSGTAILEELGSEHIATGSLIVYTSADSVLQIAASEDVIPIGDLYGICKTAREILSGRHNVNRVIARPFVMRNGRFIRTDRRKDFSVEPPCHTVLDSALSHNLHVVGIGKTGDLFGHRGMSCEIHTTGNSDGIKHTINSIDNDHSGIIFTNLVDFDTHFGHRNDSHGYARALTEFDVFLPDIIESLKSYDILMLTADHGCDPTTAGTDHTREYVPLLVYGKELSSPVHLGTRETFADVGATINEYLGLPQSGSGKSFYSTLTHKQSK